MSHPYQELYMIKGIWGYCFLLSILYISSSVELTLSVFFSAPNKTMHCDFHEYNMIFGTVS